MTVQELIEALEPMRPDLEVRMIDVWPEEPDEDGNPTFTYPNITDIEYKKDGPNGPCLLLT